MSICLEHTKIPSKKKIQRLTASQRQNAENLTHVDGRVDQLRHNFREARVDSALALQGVMQEVRGQGQGMERIRHVLLNIAMDKLEGIDSRVQKYDEVMHQALMKTDKQAHEVCTALGRLIDEQGDIRSIIEELGRQIDETGHIPEAKLRKTGRMREALHLTAMSKMSKGSLMRVLPCNWKSRI